MGIGIVPVSRGEVDRPGFGGSSCGRDQHFSPKPLFADVAGHLGLVRQCGGAAAAGAVLLGRPRATGAQNATDYAAEVPPLEVEQQEVSVEQQKRIDDRASATRRRVQERGGRGGRFGGFPKGGG